MDRTRRPDRRRMALLGVLLALAALVVVLPPWLPRAPDREVEPAMLVGVDAGPEPVASWTPHAEPPVRSAGGSASAADAPPDDAPASVQTVRVVDTGRRAVANARVVVWSDGGDCVATGTTGADGTMPLPSIDPVSCRSWRVFVVIPGARVALPLHFDPSGSVLACLGDVGTLRITCEGGDCDLQVVELRRGEPYGSGTNVATDRGEAEVAVGAGGAVYRVVGSIGDRSVAVAPIEAPRGQGDVVDVRVDMAACRVAGRFRDAPGDPRAVYAVALRNDQWRTFRVTVAEDERAFEVDLPRQPVDALWFVCMEECAACPIVLDAALRDVGEVVLEPRPHLGRLEVRDPGGTVVLGGAEVTHLTTADGRRIEAGPGARALLSQRQILGRGVDFFAVPGIVECVVAPRVDRMFAVPRVVLLAGGVHRQVELGVGGRVIVRSAELQGMQVYQLRERATGQLHGARDWSFGPREQCQTFDGLAPGHYDVIDETAEAVGAVDVLADSEHEVAVAPRPR